MVAEVVELRRAYAVLVLDAADEMEAMGAAAEAETSWQDWHAAYFPGYIQPPYAPYHAEYWDWLWAIKAEESAEPFVAIWPRGFGKSSAVEVGVAAVAARRTRRYGLYICDTQAQADDHVQNVANLLESPEFGAAYPAQSRRRLNKYKNSQGWRCNRLRTESGFTLDAVGLDSAVRGAKVDEDRPDLLVLDDVDGVLDSPAMVQKKITIITQSLLPARAPHAVALVCQNLVHQNSIVARLADGRADFLADRVVSGPHPALADAEFAQQDGGRTTIVGGTPTWPAITRDMLQAELNDIGYRAFLREKQQDVASGDEAMLKRAWWKRYDLEALPPLHIVEVYLDSAFKEGVASDYSALACWGADADGELFLVRLWRARVAFPALLRLCHDAMAWTCARFPNLEIRLVIEDKASGQSAIQTLNKPLAQLDGSVLPALLVVRFPVPSNVSKPARVEAVTSVVEAGRCHVPNTMPFLEDWLDEHDRFPNVDHDDFVDTTAMAIKRLRNAGEALGW